MEKKQAEPLWTQKGKDEAFQEEIKLKTTLEIT